MLCTFWPFVINLKFIQVYSKIQRERKLKETGLQVARFTRNIIINIKLLFVITITYSMCVKEH